MTVAPVIVRRSGVFIDVGMVSGAPLPAPLLSELLPQLTYKHIEHLRGRDQYLPDGGRRYVECTTRRLYDLADQNRLVTGFGFLPRVARALHRHGLAFTLADMTAAADTKSPTRYTPQWDRLFAVRPPESFRPRQLECLQTMAQCPGGIISAPPAFGKTELIGCWGLLYPEARIAVVVKRKDVARTIERRLHGILPSVGFFGDGQRRRGRVEIFIAKSMRRAADDFDFLLGDEIHELASDTFAEMLARCFFDARYYGFSATWDARADGDSARLEYLFGPEIFTMTWQEATALGLIVPVEVRWLPIVMSKNPCKQYKRDDVRERHGIWCNRHRNKIIAAAARKHPDEQVLILVRTVEHAVMLHTLLPEFALCYDTMAPDVLFDYKARGLLPPDYEPLSPAARDRMRRDFETKQLKRVIATDVWSTGVSFEQLAVLIRTDGRASEILDDQAPGRVVRTHAASGKERGLIYDCWDAFDARYLRHSQERFRRYAKKDWQQERPRGIGAL